MPKKPTKKRAEASSRKKEGQIERQAFSIDGNKVVIAKSEVSESLLINDRVIGFYKTEEGYALKVDAYQPPVNSLKKAAERYLAQFSAK